MFDGLRRQWDIQEPDTLPVVLSVELTLADMRKITGGTLGARRMIAGMVDADPEGAYVEFVDHLIADGRTPGAIPEAIIEAGRQQHTPLAIVGYKVFEPIEDLCPRPTVIDRLLERTVDVRGRLIAGYLTEDRRFPGVNLDGSSQE